MRQSCDEKKKNYKKYSDILPIIKLSLFARHRFRVSLWILSSTHVHIHIRTSAERMPLEIFWFTSWTSKPEQQGAKYECSLSLRLSIPAMLYKVVHPDSDNLVSAHGCWLTREWSVIVLISQHAPVRIYASFISLFLGLYTPTWSSCRGFMRSSLRHLIPRPSLSLEIDCALLSLERTACLSRRS